MNKEKLVFAFPIVLAIVVLFVLVWILFIQKPAHVYSFLDYWYDDENKTAMVKSDYNLSNYGRSFSYAGNIDIPSSVKHDSATYVVTGIHPHAFSYEKGIQSITFPSTIIESISGHYFEGCDSLVDFYVNENNPIYCAIDGVLFSKDSTTLIAYPAGRQGAYAIPDFVTEIRYNAFTGCNGLTSITIPNSVTTIKNYAFSKCNHLKTISIPNSVSEVERFVFHCDSMETITLAEDNPYYCMIDGILFSADTSVISYFPEYLQIADYVLPDKVTKIADEAFRCNEHLVSVTLSKGVTRISDFAFIECNNLKTVKIPDGVTYIGEYAFSDCGNLVSADIPNSVQVLGDHAFRWCENLSSVNIPEGVPEIGVETFLGCANLKSVKIPNSVTWIGCQAFRECENLTYVEIGNSVERIESYAFCGCPLKSVKLPNSLTTIGYDAFDPDVLKETKIPSSVVSFNEDCNCGGHVSYHFY